MSHKTLLDPHLFLCWILGLLLMPHVTFWASQTQLHIWVVLVSQIIPQFFCHNSNMANCEWLFIIYIWTHHFFLPITLYHVTVMTKNCEKLCDPKLFPATLAIALNGLTWLDSTKTHTNPMINLGSNRTRLLNWSTKLDCWLWLLIEIEFSFF